jgi:hypothetical protein
VAAERARDLIQRWPKLEMSTRQEFIRNVLSRVIVGQTAVWIEVDKSKLAEALVGRKLVPGVPGGNHRPDNIKLTANFQPHRRRGELYLLTPTSSLFDRTPIPSLVKVVARARDWYEQIVTGKISTVAEIAKKAGMPACDVKHTLKYAILSPQVTEAILTGRHPPNLTLRELRDGISLDWVEQQKKILLLV